MLSSLERACARILASGGSSRRRRSPIFSTLIVIAARSAVKSADTQRAAAAIFGPKAAALAPSCCARLLTRRPLVYAPHTPNNTRAHSSVSCYRAPILRSSPRQAKKNDAFDRLARSYRRFLLRPGLICSATFGRRESPIGAYTPFNLESRLHTLVRFFGTCNSANCRTWRRCSCAKTGQHATAASELLANTCSTKNRDDTPLASLLIDSARARQPSASTRARAPQVADGRAQKTTLTVDE